MLQQRLSNDIRERYLDINPSIGQIHKDRYTKHLLVENLRSEYMDHFSLWFACDGTDFANDPISLDYRKHKSAKSR